MFLTRNKENNFFEVGGIITVYYYYHYFTCHSLRRQWDMTAIGSGRNLSFVRIQN